MTDDLFLESGRNVNSLQGGKSEGIITCISPSMLIGQESHLVLLEMTQ